MKEDLSTLMFDIFENNALNDEDKFFHTSILGRGMEGGGRVKIRNFQNNRVFGLLMQ